MSDLIPLKASANTSKLNRQVLSQGTNDFQHQNFGKGVQALDAQLYLPWPIWQYYPSKP